MAGAANKSCEQRRKVAPELVRFHGFSLFISLVSYRVASLPFRQSSCVTRSFLSPFPLLPLFSRARYAT